MISICMPTWRGAAHLAAAIDSVLAQSYSDFELIIVDDASPDATTDIVANYKDARIRLLCNQVNLGAEGNWNRALGEASGKYFKLMPQDDLLAPDCLASQVAVFEADEQQRIAFVFGGRDIIDPNGRLLMRRAAFGSQRRELAATDLILACVRAGTNLIGEPGNVLMRRELTQRIGAFDGTYGYMIDLDYWFRALAFGDAVYLPQSLSSFRISAGSWSVAIGARQQREFRDFLTRYLDKNPHAPRVGTLDRARAAGMAMLNAKLRGLIYRRLLRT